MYDVYIYFLLSSNNAKFFLVHGTLNKDTDYQLLFYHLYKYVQVYFRLVVITILFIDNTKYEGPETLTLHQRSDRRQFKEALRLC